MYNGPGVPRQGKIAPSTGIRNDFSRMLCFYHNPAARRAVYGEGLVSGFHPWGPDALVSRAGR
jgi:hypothetical protein